MIQQLGHARMPRPRNIVLFDWETGAEPGIGEDLSGPFEVLGEVTARMHLHTRNWKRPPGFSASPGILKQASARASPTGAAGAMAWALMRKSRNSLAAQWN